MLNKIIRTYQNTRLATIKKFTNQHYDILDEAGFLDDGYISKKIEGLKIEYAKLDNQIDVLLLSANKDDYTKQKIATLLDQKDDIHLYIAFLSSNSMNSIEFAIQLVQNQKTDFCLCLEALYHFKQNREKDALDLFEKYFMLHQDPLDHFLINKIYGVLLLRYNQIEKAIKFLRIATEKRPDDREVHQLLLQTYGDLGMRDQGKIHQKILDLLGDD